MNRVHCARELGQDTIPCRVGDPTSMLTDEPVHDLPMGREGLQRANFVRPH